MPSSHPTQTSETLDATSGQGPGPHEDLTIAEEIETMRCSEENRPHKVCLLMEDESNQWVDQEKLEHFLNEHGALHSSDYKSIHGNTWIDDLLKA